MRAKAKTIVLAVAFCASSVSVGLAQAPNPAMSQQEKCAYMATIDADKLRQALTAYSGEVMGKAPEHWTDADYLNLATNAAACDGKPANVENKVDAEFWRMKLEDVRTFNSEINAKSQGIAKAYGQYWKSDGPFPACAVFLKWKRDDLWLTNNSEELFGTAFMEMTPDMRGFYKRIVQECQPVIAAILERWRVSRSEAEVIVKSIVKSIELDSMAAQEAEMDIPQVMNVHKRGDRVPIAYLRPSTQKVVKRVIELERANRIMPTNSLLQISKWAEQVENTDEDGPDLLYAKVIKDVIANHLFRAADQYRNRPESPR